MTDTTKDPFEHLRVETDYDDGATSLMCHHPDCMQDAPTLGTGTYKKPTPISRFCDDSLSTVIEEARLHNAAHHRSSSG